MIEISNHRKRVWMTAGAVLCVALAVNLGFGLALGLRRPMESDAHYFLQAAVSLAEGHGYKIQDTFWPDSPAMSRSPGWPFVVSLGLRLLPSISPDVVIRCLCLIVNSLIALGVFLLARRLFDRISVAALAGFGYVVHPVGLYLAYDGDSELLFVLLVLIGVLLLLQNDFPRLSVGGFLTLGLATLVRPNFILWIVFIVVLGALRLRRSSALLHSRLGVWCRMVVCVLLFILPSFFWAVRNYQVCGHFPVLSTLRGQTFYGGNNTVVAKDFKYWGYWVFPNSIPGEKPMVELAKTLTEYEVDAYYYSKGKQYIAGNPLSMPRLLIGKLVRAYVPIPWRLTRASGVVSAYRWLLYLVALIGIWGWWKHGDGTYRIVFLAIVMTNIATVLVFWGCSRFAFPLDPFLFPFAAAVVGGMGRRYGER